MKAPRRAGLSEKPPQSADPTVKPRKSPRSLDFLGPAPRTADVFSRHVPDMRSGQPTLGNLSGIFTDERELRTIQQNPGFALSLQHPFALADSDEDQLQSKTRRSPVKGVAWDHGQSSTRGADSRVSSGASRWTRHDSATSSYTSGKNIKPRFAQNNSENRSRTPSRSTVATPAVASRPNSASKQRHVSIVCFK